MQVVLRRILNLLLYLSFCVMIGTGLLMAYRLIPGSRGGQGLEVLGWNRHDWGDLHTWFSYAFIALASAHLAINWAWLMKCAAKGHAWRLAAGLLLGLAIISTFLLLPVTHRQGGRARHRRESPSVSRANEFIQASPATTGAISFEKDIRPIFEASCFSCHGPEKQRANFRADQRDDFFLDGDNGSLIRPGKSDESRLVAIISGAVKMKRNSQDHVLASKEISLIKAWIDRGARW